MVVTDNDLVRAGSLEELKQKGCLVVSAGGHTRRRLLARGPLLGGRQPLPAHGLPAEPRHRLRRPADLPLAPRPLRPGRRRHARPVRRQRAQLPGRGPGRRQVFVDVSPERGDRRAHWRARLEEGLEDDLALVLAKATLALLQARRRSARDRADRGALRRCATAARGWGMGMTILTAMANVLPGAGAGRTPAGAVPRRCHGWPRTAPASRPASISSRCPPTTCRWRG